MGSISPLKAIVIGAGSAGLLMANIFKKADIDVTVFEQDSNPPKRHRDWSFGIYWAQSRIEESLPPGTHARIETAVTDPTYKSGPNSVIPIFNGSTCELMKNLDAAYGIRLKRRAWLDVIKDGIDVQYEKRLVSISTEDNEVIATFADGHVERGNLLIGAEGSKSVTRDWLFASSPKDGALINSLAVATTTLTTVDPETAVALKKLHPLYCIIFNPNGLYAWFSAQDTSSPDPAKWTFMVIATWLANEDTGLDNSSEAILNDVKIRAQVMAYPFKEAIASIPRGTKMWHARMNYWPTRPWDGKGTVTLAGDAAHPMTFHRGQGLGNAITDVTELQTHLRAMAAHTPAELAKAVRAYEKEVWERGNEVVLQNADNTLAVHDWENITESGLFAAGVVREVSTSTKGGEGVNSKGKMAEEKTA
ncbi:hypothetical protein B0H63DRAFT_523416 [Podospora didyma]|uniref:FAD-binding domain-containing protein n=1 Tax=Podospora didyma TaxID=330526 RepID=A0AAE0U0G6_9PEZI|nr:hypothetical protein B0H63DRAFT_523416 [Podospora didyma]